MPLTVRCKECGYILYSGSFSALRIGIMFASLYERVAKKNRWRCPRCRRELEIPFRTTIRIGPVDEPR